MYSTCQLHDAALPQHHEVPDASEPLAGVPVSISVDVPVLLPRVHGLLAEGEGLLPPNAAGHPSVGGVLRRRRRRAVVGEGAVVVPHGGAGRRRRCLPRSSTLAATAAQRRRPPALPSPNVATFDDPLPTAKERHCCGSSRGKSHITHKRCATHATTPSMCYVCVFHLRTSLTHHLKLCLRALITYFGEVGKKNLFIGGSPFSQGFLFALLLSLPARERPFYSYTYYSAYQWNFHEISREKEKFSDVITVGKNNKTVRWFWGKGEPISLVLLLQNHQIQQKVALMRIKFTINFYTIFGLSSTHACLWPE